MPKQDVTRTRAPNDPAAASVKPTLDERKTAHELDQRKAGLQDDHDPGDRGQQQNENEQRDEMMKRYNVPPERRD